MHWTVPTAKNDPAPGVNRAEVEKPALYHYFYFCYLKDKTFLTTSPRIFQEGHIQKSPEAKGIYNVCPNLASIHKEASKASGSQPRDTSPNRHTFHPAQRAKPPQPAPPHPPSAAPGLTQPSPALCQSGPLSPASQALLPSVHALDPSPHRTGKHSDTFFFFYWRAGGTNCACQIKHLEIHYPMNKKETKLC